MRYISLIALLCVQLTALAQYELQNFKVQYDSCRVNFNKGKYDQAATWLEENLPAARFKQKEVTYWDMNNLLARCYVKMGKTKRAEQSFQETIQYYESKTSKLEKYHPNVQSAYINLGYLYWGLRQYDMAEIYYSKALETKKAAYTERHPDYVAMVNNLAVVYHTQGRNIKADSLYNLLLRLRRETKTENSPEYMQALYNKALLYKNTGRFVDAEPMFAKIVAYRRLNPGEKSPEYMLSYKHLGQVYAFQRRYEEAEPIMTRLVDLNKQLYGEKHKEYSEALNNLGSLYISQEKYSEAERIFLDVANIKRNTLGKNHIEHAAALSNLGLLYRKMSKYNQAEKNYKRSLDIYEDNVGKKHMSYVVNLVNLASLYREMGRFLDAETRYNKAKEIYETTIGKDNLEYAGLLNNMALFYTELGKYEKAETFYKESLDITSKVLGEEHPDFATSLNNLASLYKSMGRYEEAEGIYLRSSNIRKTTMGEKNFDYATSLNNLGALYEIMGRFTDAEEYYLQSLAIIRVIFGDRHPSYANQLNNLAGLYEVMGPERYIDADRLYNQALEIQSEKLGEKHPDYVATLNNLALLQQKTGNFEKAEELYRKNVSKTKATYGENHPSYATALSNLAGLYEAQAKYKEAERLYEEALVIRKVALGDKHPAYGNTLTSMARLYSATKSFVKADSSWFKAINLDLYEIQKYFPSMSEKEKGEFYNTIKEYFEQFNSYAILRAKQDPSILGRMYNYQLATKALLLNSSNKLRQSILESNDSTLIYNFKEWLAQKEYLSKVYAMSEEDRKIQYINVDSLEKVTNQMERNLSQSSDLFRNANETQYYTWKDVKKVLRPGEAAMEIIRFPKFKFDSAGVYTDSVFYAALIVKYSTVNNPELVLMREGYVMETKLLKYYRNSIKQQLEDEYCYLYFWKAIGEALKGVKKVYISPDGVYNQISINTLQNMKTKQYVYDEIEVQVVSNTKDLLQKKPVPLSEKSIVLCGNPNFMLKEKTKRSEAGYDENSQVKYSPTLAPLPGTEQEVKQIDYIASQNNWNSKVLIGSQVTEEKVKALKSTTIIHIATHGFFDNDVSKNKAKAAGKVVENPLMKSGLMLSGSDITLQNKKKGIITHNEGQKEDGILTAYEAMNLNLDHTEIVVLSACETGLGEVKNGEGVYGLQRSFQVAGARSIINSLWTVNDQTTMLLMTSFYKKWMANGDKKKAFREAQATVRKQYPQPYYWGAFVMIGD